MCILKAIGTLLTKASSYLPDFMNDHFLRIQSGKIPFAETVPNGHLYSLTCFITQGDVLLLQSKHRGAKQPKIALAGFSYSQSSAG